MRKIRAFMMLVALAALMSSCNHDQKVIAIINLQRHPILDAIQNNVLSTLKAGGYEDGKNVKLILKNANGQTNLIPAIASEVQAEHPDLVVTISTPITQQFLKSSKAPIVFGAVTDPVGSNVVKSLDQPEPNITGTADVLPYEQQIALIRSIHPAAKRMGIIYNPAEASSVFAMKHIKVDAPKYGFQLVEKTVAKSLDIQQAAAALVKECDIILVSSDNTVTGGIAVIINLGIKNKIPVYAGDEGSIQRGAIASYSINYDQLGKATGDLCLRVLKGEKNIPVYVSSKGDLVINTKAAELMGVKLPAEIISKAVRKYDTIQ